MMRAIGVSLATAALNVAAIAQEVSPFNTESCPERPEWRWCASKASQQGWKLKYEDTSPADMMDGAWHVEIWVRGQFAMLCEFKTTRGSTLANHCSALREVDR